jgi:hypothetical protein
MRRSALYDGVALPTFLLLKRLLWAGHTVRMDESCFPPQKVMGRYFQRKKAH